MFHTQTAGDSACLAYGQIQILVPMLSSVLEITQTLHLIESAKQSLRNEKTSSTKNKSGGMIEIPAAALCLDISCVNWSSVNWDQ